MPIFVKKIWTCLSNFKELDVRLPCLDMANLCTELTVPYLRPVSFAPYHNERRACEPEKGGIDKILLKKAIEPAWPKWA